MKKTPSRDGLSASQLITNQIAELGDWRGKMLARLRKMILAAAPDITEGNGELAYGRKMAWFAPPVLSKTT
jgi:hypothetical protein